MSLYYVFIGACILRGYNTKVILGTAPLIIYSIQIAKTKIVSLHNLSLTDWPCTHGPIGPGGYATVCNKN